jgi:hypothetical protein
VRKTALSAVIFTMVAGASSVDAQVPLPRPRPDASDRVATPTPSPLRGKTLRSIPSRVGATRAPTSAVPPPAEEGAPCTDLLAENIAMVEIESSMSGLSGQALCGDIAPARLTGVRLRDGGVVELRPPALARCEMAHAFARWIRDDLAPALTTHEGSLQRIEIAGSYTCRPRNNVAGARLSEHGLANAIDVGAVVLSKAGRIRIDEPTRPAILFSEMRRTACARFTTVLGPGADAAHAHHLHVDLARRRGGYRICQWHQADDPMP